VGVSTGKRVFRGPVDHVGDVRTSVPVIDAEIAILRSGPTAPKVRTAPPGAGVPSATSPAAADLSTDADG